MSGVVPPLIHIGYHKTGTTWLQEGLFSTATFGPLAPRREARDDFVPVNPFRFDATAIAAKYADAVRRVTGRGAYPVVSHERLSGNPHSGSTDSRTIADRLQLVFPNARILVVIREQSAMLGSLYKQYVFKGGAASLATYSRDDDTGRARMPTFRLEALEYHHLIGYYQHLFSPENVLVLPYEQLRADPTAFVGAITRHVDVTPPTWVDAAPSNSSSPTLATHVKRQLNGWFLRRQQDRRISLTALAIANALPSSLHRRADDRYHDQVAALAGTRYARSNAKTSACAGLDLHAWGYPTTPCS